MSAEGKPGEARTLFRGTPEFELWRVVDVKGLRGRLGFALNYYLEDLEVQLNRGHAELAEQARSTITQMIAGFLSRISEIDTAKVEALLTSPGIAENEATTLKGNLESLRALGIPLLEEVKTMVEKYVGEPPDFQTAVRGQLQPLFDLMDGFDSDRYVEYRKLVSGEERY